MSNIIHLNEPELKNQLGELVRETLEDTLNKLLDAEADKMTNASRYERSGERLDTRAGHYTRKLMTLQESCGEPRYLREPSVS